LDNTYNSSWIWKFAIYNFLNPVFEP
jgi:hypothetical protein